MNVNNIKNEGSARHYSIVISAEEIQNKINISVQELVKNYKMPGFRAGKVPINFIVKKHGVAIRSEVVENIVKEAINNIVKDNKFDLASNPSIDDLVNEANKDLSFILKFEVLPEIVIPNLKDIQLEQPVPDVTEHDVEQKLIKLTEFYKEFKRAPNNAKAKMGDQLLIDFEGFVDGVAFSGGKAENHELELGSNSFIDGFESQLVGSKENDEKTIKVTFPQKYSSAELAGKEANFIVIVKEVREAQLAELNDEFLKKINMESLEVLKTKMLEQIKDEYSEAINPIMKIKLFDQIETKLDFTAPESLVNKEFDALWQQLQSIKDNDPTIAEKNEEDLKNYYQKIALRRVKIGLMLAEYAKVKNIKITSDDLNKAVMQQVKLYPNSYQAIFNHYKQNPQAVEALKGPIIEDKTVNLIFQNEITLTTKNYKLAELDKMIDEENNKEVL